MPDQHDDLPMLGPAYSAVRELGGGGMSRVFIAREHALEREVVVKLLIPELAESLSSARFAREIKLAAALQEPHIVPLLSAGATPDGVPYYTMPFVRGESLRARLTAGQVPRAEAAAILRDVARALQYAHEHGVVHRDIKPENILLSSQTAMVTDFGIAKALRAAREEGRQTSDATQGSALTSIGMSLGTPAYMAPEQAAGDTAVDHRADIYAWGVVAWELLAGRHPFADRTTAQRLIAAHISEKPPQLTKVPAALARLVMRCLEKDPARRPQSAGELLTELSAAEGSNVSTLSLGRAAIAVIAVIAILALVTGVRFLATRRESRIASAAPDAHSLGVLPFANLSSDKGNEYFSEGMTQEIADALGRVPGLRVAFHRPQGGSAPTDPRELSAALHVRMLLQGTVQREGNRVRVTARLLNGEDGFQAWSGKFDREASDVFALQDAVARAIASELQLTLATGSTSLARVSTKDPEAHNLYLEGMYLWYRRGSDNIYKSVTRFEQALQRDPKFARAWAGIALAYAIVITWDDVDADLMLDRAVAAAQKALAIDSTTSDAWTALARAQSSRWNNTAAVVAYEKAIALDPNNATAQQWYAEMLARGGKFDEARTHILKARELAPLSLVVNTQIGRIELQARNYPKAKEALLHVLTLDSTYLTGHTLLGAVYLQEKNFDLAIAEFKKSMDYSNLRRSLTLGFLGNAYAMAGRPDSARMILRELERRQRAGEPILHGSLALLYDTLGDRERAIAQLDTAVDRYDAAIQMHGREVIFDALRKDPRGRKIFARAEDR